MCSTNKEGSKAEVLYSYNACTRFTKTCFKM